MTAIRKPLRREVGDLGLRGGDRGQYILTLYPDAVIGLRRKRSARELNLSLAEIYRIAAAREADRLRSERAKP